jgi:hypothetical protein
MENRNLVLHRIRNLFEKLRKALYPFFNTPFAKKKPAKPVKAKSDRITQTTPDRITKTFTTPNSTVISPNSITPDIHDAEFDYVDEETPCDEELLSNLNLSKNLQFEDDYASPIYSLVESDEFIIKEPVEVQEVESMHWYVGVLELLNIFIVSLKGMVLVSIIGDRDNLIADYLDRLDFVVVQDDTFDFLISIPDTDSQVQTLQNAVESKKPFILYLSMYVLDDNVIDAVACRLNLIIVGSSAWFIGYFPVELAGNGGLFQLSKRPMSKEEEKKEKKKAYNKVYNAKYRITNPREGH